MRKLDLFPRRPLRERVRAAVTRWLRQTFGLVPAGDHAELQARYGAAVKEHAAEVAQITRKVDELWPIMLRLRRESDSLPGNRITIQVDLETHMLRAFREFDFEYLGQSLARQIAHKITGALMRGEISQPIAQRPYQRNPYDAPVSYQKEPGHRSESSDA